MKQFFFCVAAITGLLTVSCRKIEMDGDKEVIVIPGGGGGTGQTYTLQGRINADTTLHKGNTYILKGLVYMIVLENDTRSLPNNCSKELVNRFIRISKA